MELYTDLEQALRDTSLVFITESITTEKELIRNYVRYKALSRKWKRVSDYYSNEFLGHTVPEMYVFMRGKLKMDNYSFDEKQLPNEKYTHSEPDLYYHEDSFNSGDTNICFILGHSGSGKSMMARTLEGEEIDHIELDDLLLAKDHFSMEELKEYSDMFYSYFNGEGAKYYIGIEERENIPKEEYEDKVFIDFVRYAMDYAKQHADKKFIIDGIWIYLYFEDPSIFEDYAVFIKGTSFLKSKMRVLSREMKKDKDTLNDRKQMFGRETRNYLLDEDKINAFRAYFADKSETAFRLETKESEKKDEQARETLINVGRCFMKEDADGIEAILNQTIEDKELSGLNKMRIINECKSALFDLNRMA